MHEACMHKACDLLSKDPVLQESIKVHPHEATALTVKLRIVHHTAALKQLFSTTVTTTHHTCAYINASDLKWFFSL